MGVFFFFFFKLIFLCGHKDLEESMESWPWNDEEVGNDSLFLEGVPGVGLHVGGIGKDGDGVSNHPPPGSGVCPCCGDIGVNASGGQGQESNRVTVCRFFRRVCAALICIQDRGDLGEFLSRSEVGCEEPGAMMVLRDVQKKWGTPSCDAMVLERMESLLRDRVSLAEVALLRACGGVARGAAAVRRQGCGVERCQQGSDRVSRVARKGVNKR